MGTTRRWVGVAVCGRRGPARTLSCVLVGRIPRRINRSQEQLEGPEVGCQGHGRVDAGHLLLFDLERSSDVYEISDLGVGVETVEEAARLLVLAHLGELVGDRAGAQWCAGKLISCMLDGVEDGVVVLPGGLAVRDGDDENGDLHLALPGALQHEGLEDLAAEFGADGGAAAEVDRLDEAVHVGLVADVVALGGAVDEPDGHAVGVEEGGGVGRPVENTHHVPDALAALGQHGAAVVDVDDDVEERKAHYVLADLERDLPRPAQLLHLGTSDACDVCDVRRVTEGGHVLEVLPDALLQALAEEVLVGLRASCSPTCSRRRPLGPVGLEAAGRRRVRLLLLLVVSAGSSGRVRRISLEAVCQLPRTRRQWPRGDGRGAVVTC